MPRYRLTRTDAIDIWIARWLRQRRKDIVARYDCDSRRIYEVWEEKTFIGTRQEALASFERDYPALVGQTDFSPHRRIPRPGADPATQPDLFEPAED